jgi:TipAS antibiotic-recognition domain
MQETLAETYFTPEQIQTIQHQREKVGHEQLERAQEEWAEVITAIRAEMHPGTDPADAKVRALARCWQDLVTRSTLGDPGIQEAVMRLWEEQGARLAAQ